MNPLIQTLQQEVAQSPKIYFSQKVFGKANKNRSEDPSMFELLQWSSPGIEHTNFKKNQKFNDPQSAYINMISKQPWLSQSQQNFLNYHTNSIEVNQIVFNDVQNYLHSKQSGQKMTKISKKAYNQQKKNQAIKQNQNNKTNIQKQKNNKNQNQNELKVNQKQQKNVKEIQRQSKQVKVFQKTPNVPRKVHQGQRQFKSIQSSKRPHSSKIVSEMCSPAKRKISKQKYNITNPSQIYGNTMSVERQGQITQQQQEKLIENFKQTTRWIPNSAFITYFGKPPFQNYGRGNTKPVDGGLVYGTYLYSHNVFPHRGANSPAKIQSYPVALMKAQSTGKLVPTQPRTPCKYLQNKIKNQRQIQYSNKGAIEAAKNTFKTLQIQAPNLHGVEKFGGYKKKNNQSDYETNYQSPQEGRSSYKR